MIELKHDSLQVSFPEVHPEAKLDLHFQRTLRIPDDGRDYPLPPGLGNFPLRHVDDYATNVSEKWLQHGGVMLPMYQSEAMWLNLDSAFLSEHDATYPFAIKVASGKQCAVSGTPWSEGLHRSPQDYLVAPMEPWLDGFVIARGVIRQFVAMPLGSGYTAEEQLTGRAETGGVQIAIYPMKRDVFERRFPKHPLLSKHSCRDTYRICIPFSADLDMGLSPGGRMRQEIFEDPFDLSDWDLAAGSRCFVHLCNSMVWQSITGSPPPHPAPTAAQYTGSGMPWFDYYDDSNVAVAGSAKLKGLKSVAEMSAEKGQVVLPENESVTPHSLVTYRKGLKAGQVRESHF